MALKIGTTNIKYVVKGETPLPKVAVWETEFNEYIATSNIQTTVYDPIFDENYSNVYLVYSDVRNINTTTRTFTCNLSILISVNYQREEFAVQVLVGNFNDNGLRMADYASPSYSEVSVNYSSINITFNQTEWNNIYVGQNIQVEKIIYSKTISSIPKKWASSTSAGFTGSPHANSYINLPTSSFLPSASGYPVGTVGKVLSDLDEYPEAYYKVVYDFS